MSSQKRPTGITILAVLAVIGGLLGLLGGLALLVFVPPLGVIVLVVAILDFAFAYGAWTLKPWGWTLGVALQVVSLLLAVWYIANGSSIISQGLNILIAVIILFYLFQKSIQEAFGRG